MQSYQIIKKMQNYQTPDPIFMHKILKFFYFDQTGFDLV